MMNGLFDEFNEQKLLFVSGVPEWAFWCFALLAVAAIVVSWFDLKGVRPSVRVVLTVLRGLVLVLAISLVAEPAIELRQVSRQKNHVLVMVDDSRSMGLSFEEGTRWGAVSAFLESEREWLTADHADHQVHLMPFSREGERVSFESVVSEGFIPDGQRTDILSLLDNALAEDDLDRLGGVVLISDGADNGVLDRRMGERGTLDSLSAEEITSLGVPVHTLAVGDPDGFRDISIEDLFVDDFAFVRNRVSVDVVIGATGIPSQEVPVTLRRNGQVLRVNQVSISPEMSPETVRFEFIPEDIGTEIYSVDLPVLAEEQIVENNEQHFTLRVIRDKIRVLHVAGRPSWDERFLRERLKRNPNIDLISFFILRNNEDLQLVPGNEMSLIPFPTDELFDEQLGSFDLVVFQDFTFRPHGMYRYLDDIAEYVNGGGAFAMIGGEQSFGAGGYSGTPIAEILPVMLTTGQSEEGEYDLAEFRPYLSESGRRHPVTQLRFSSQENREEWEQLPNLQGTNLVRGLMPDATVLLEHPTLRSEGDAMPVLSVMQVGRGRTLALTVDSSWLWAYEQVTSGETSRSYSTFWNNAMRWLIRDPDLSLVDVEVRPGTVEPGVEFEVVIQVYHPDYSPASDVSGFWQVNAGENEGGESMDIYVPLFSGEFSTDERGRAVVHLTVDRPGQFQVEASLLLPGMEELSDSVVFLSETDSVELASPSPRQERLASISEVSGGSALWLGEAEMEALDFLPAQTTQVDRREIVELWHSLPILLLIAFLLLAEWVLRRRVGRI